MCCVRRATLLIRNVPYKLQLQGRAGMLFLPERNERGLKPVAHRAQAVDTGVASGAEGDQKARPMDSRTAMVNGERPLRPTASAAAVVAIENVITVTGKAAAGMRLAPIAAEHNPRA